jgi:hypothetical protein
MLSNGIDDSLGPRQSNSPPHHEKSSSDQNCKAQKTISQVGLIEKDRKQRADSTRGVQRLGSRGEALRRIRSFLWRERGLIITRLPGSAFKRQILAVDEAFLRAWDSVGLCVASMRYGNVLMKFLRAKRANKVAASGGLDEKQQLSRVPKNGSSCQ